MRFKEKTREQNTEQRDFGNKRGVKVKEMHEDKRRRERNKRREKGRKNASLISSKG